MTVLRRAVLAIALCVGSAAGQTRADVLLRGGRVVDGTGSAEHLADIAVTGDRISFVGDARAAGITAAREIDARGLIVAPGFIDPHTHTSGDLSGQRTRGNEAFLMQGVTTVLTGNDGGGPIDVGTTLATWDRQGIGTNAALYVGHGTIRGSVLGRSDSVPTPAQLDRMRGMVMSAMRQGALGLSTGLYYVPGSYSKTEEVIELAKVAAQFGGVYDSHMRDESSYSIGLLGSIAETIRIGREANIPVNISHIKALGTEVWGQSDSAIALIRAARAAGVRVTADQYPYTASSTGLSAALLPRWAEVGGNDSLRARMTNPPTRARLVADMELNLRRRNGPESILLLGGDSTTRGKTLRDVAQRRGVSAVEAALQLLGGGGGGSIISFNMNEADIDKFMVQDFVMTGSDGSGGHPRKYGTFPRKFHEYVVQRKLLTIPQFVHRSSALAAETFKLTDRGVLRAGLFADIVVFDEQFFADRSTYTEPELLATGLRYALVNGKLAVDNGQPTGVMAGRALRGAGTAR